MVKSWYVVHTYSGFEKKVKSSIIERATAEGLAEKIGQVLVPEERVIEIREGTRRELSRKFFPGYLLIEMEDSEETQRLVKTTPKVTGFVGGGARPTPLSSEEVELLLKQVEQGTASARSHGEFQKDDAVRIVDGPFISFEGVVDEINKDQGRLKVMVSIFGRSTPVELSFLQVERLR